MVPSRVCGREAEFSFGLLLGKAGRLLDTRMGVPAGTPVDLRTPFIISVGPASLVAGCTLQWSHKRLLCPLVHIVLPSSKPVSIFSHRSTLSALIHSAMTTTPQGSCGFLSANLISLLSSLPQTGSRGQAQPRDVFPWSAGHLGLCGAHSRPCVQSTNK